MNDTLILIFQTVLFLAIKVINRCFFVVAGSPKYFILTVSEVMLLFYQRILTRLDFTSSDQTSDKERPVVWKKTLQSKIITSVTNGIQICIIKYIDKSLLKVFVWILIQVGALIFVVIKIPTSTYPLISQTKRQRSWHTFILKIPSGT